MKKLVFLIVMIILLNGCGAYSGSYQFLTINTLEYGIETSYAIAFPKGSNLVSHFNSILTNMKNDNTLDCLISYWTQGEKDSCYAKINFSTKVYHYDYDGGNENLVILTSSGYEPFEFRRNNILMGFDIDLANFIAKELNYNLTWDDVSFDKIVGDLAYNRANLAIAAITPTLQRRNSVDFSDIYVDESRTVALSRTDDNITSITNLKDKVVCAQTGTVQALLVEQLKNKGIVKDYLLLPYPATAMESLRTRKIDAIFIEQSIAEGLIKSYSK